MSLELQLARCFSRSTRERGFDYFRRRRVKIEFGSATEARASVQGSDLYNTIVRREDGEVLVYCDCPYFVDRAEPCKHLWATVLAAQQATHLTDLVPSSGIRELDVDSILLEFEGDLDLEAARQSVSPTSPRQISPPPRPAPPPVPLWKQKLEPLLGTPELQYSSGLRLEDGAEVVYLLRTPAGPEEADVSLIVAERGPRKTGDWKVPRPLRIRREQIPALPNAEDRELVAILAGGGSSYGYNSYYEIPSPCVLPGFLAQFVMPRILRSGRCFRTDAAGKPLDTPLAWDDGPAWEFTLQLQEAPEGGFSLDGDFRREGARLDLDQVVHLYKSGYLLTRATLAPAAKDASQRWFNAVRKNRPLAVPADQLPAFLDRMFGAAATPRLELPPSLGVEETARAPRPLLKLERARAGNGAEWFRARLWFDYDARTFSSDERVSGLFDADAGCWMRRDRAAESAAEALLESLGAARIPEGWQQAAGWNVPTQRLPAMVTELLGAGWRVMAEGKDFRRPGATRAQVTSGIDWFDLNGIVDYDDDATAQLPELLAALERGEKMIELGDGSYGLIPEEWLRRFAAVGSMGRVEDGGIRFAPAQAGLLDALLAAQPAVGCDAAFARIRDGLKRFERIEPAMQPMGFVGQLRPYQLEGLGWMQFLAGFSLGGCLADDMGVGKTAQVLALLESRRVLCEKGKLAKPSLAVVPKSLVFNWKQEVARFTPQLRVLDHTGLGRDASTIAEHDLVLTTYGTLRRDVPLLKDFDFDYVILDEAQAIKNAQTESAKAVRLLRGDHRLALSGTPVENHIGELWSLFEFLNPGLLGNASIFKLANGGQRGLDDDTRAILACGLRPLILRRTKQEVAKDLPAKTEQTIYCELEPRERKLYNQLRQHYRESLLPQMEKEGVAKTRIQVLEALLRLRQAACHPGLVDQTHARHSSAKLDLLFEQLQDVLQEGHKALVFSQFTSLLAIVRKRLDAQSIPYEYLDGKTRDREERAQRFQTDPACGLFLISLKAGGIGLNLTAADYVFILDPWWNPAVEAQAVDRTHRIGQQRQVFAYRLIARDTVEEKVLALQDTKRQLADAILGASTSLVRDLGREDIKLLLS